MAITRGYESAGGGSRLPLSIHRYTDDGAAGGKIVLTSEPVIAPAVPVNSGGILSASRQWLIISLENLGSDITWTTAPKFRGSNIHGVINPAYDFGFDLPAVATEGSFGATILSGAEQCMYIDSRYSACGVILQAEAPAQNLDLKVHVVSKIRS